MATSSWLQPFDRVDSLHSRPIASPSTCRAAFQHDRSTEILSLLIIVGLIISYLPQHYRIIHNRNSAGFSPLYLLLGSISSASSLFNIVTLQWGTVACCKYWTSGQCFESSLGVVQVLAQWLCFNLIFVLYLIYFPRSAKYIRSIPLDSHSIPAERAWLDHLIPQFMRTTTPTNDFVRPTTITRTISRTSSHSTQNSDSHTSNSDFDPRAILLPGQVRHSRIIPSPEYRRAVSMFVLVVLHFILTLLTTVILLVTLPKEPAREGTPSREHPSERAVRVWATTCGILSLIFACFQFTPQLFLTAKTKLVGSLSIPMMLLQTPGSFVFVYTLAVRPGVNFSAWATYFVSGVLQGSLLVMCLCWKRRQARLGIDDWGNKFDQGEAEISSERSRLIR